MHPCVECAGCCIIGAEVATPLLVGLLSHHAGLTFPASLLYFATYMLLVDQIKREYGYFYCTMSPKMLLLVGKEHLLVSSSNNYCGPI